MLERTKQTDKIALKCAIEYDYTKVMYFTTWKGYLVYEFGYADFDGPLFIGPPRFILVKDGRAEMSSIDVGEQIAEDDFNQSGLAHD